jgi:hypothetical protein
VAVQPDGIDAVHLQRQPVVHVEPLGRLAVGLQPHQQELTQPGRLDDRLAEVALDRLELLAVHDPAALDHVVDAELEGALAPAHEHEVRQVPVRPSSLDASGAIDLLPQSRGLHQVVLTVGVDVHRHRRRGASAALDAVAVADDEHHSSICPVLRSASGRQSRRVSSKSRTKLGSAGK